ncbi:MAG: alpha/beta hydrolase [Alphaproteobacteria bacterium]
MSATKPDLAARALQGLARYESAPRSRTNRTCSVIASVGPASLRDCGGNGPPAVLVPSLINPPHVLDLDEESSLAAAVAGMGRTALLVDWGKAGERSGLDLGGHVEQLLLPLLRQSGGQPALVGYCLGGTMAIAAANLMPVERVATLAAPWRFSAYPAESRESLQRLWENAGPAAARLGALPMEVLQGAFWSLDPERTVAKFAEFAGFEVGSDKVRRFIALEDWSNEGEPLPYPAARELIEDLFDLDRPGRGEWRVGGRIVSDSLGCPLLNVTAADDRITPAAAAPAGEAVQLDSGHVGMVVGSARAKLHEALAKFLDAPCR